MATRDGKQVGTAPRGSARSATPTRAAASTGSSGLSSRRKGMGALTHPNPRATGRSRSRLGMGLACSASSKSGALSTEVASSSSSSSTIATASNSFSQPSSTLSLSSPCSPVRSPDLQGDEAALQHLSQDEEQEIEEAFQLFDSDKDGFLDSHEFKVAMKALGFDPLECQQEITALWQQYSNERGLLAHDDFSHIMKEKYLSRDPEEEMRKAFTLFANQETGKIDFSALRSVADELDLPEQVEDAELQAMIQEFDLNEDGVIDEEEFLEIMRQAQQF